MLTNLQSIVCHVACAFRVMSIGFIRKEVLLSTTSLIQKAFVAIHSVNDTLEVPSLQTVTSDVQLSLRVRTKCACKRRLSKAEHLSRSAFAAHSFRCQTCLGLQAGPPCRLFVGSASKPGSESIRRVSVWSSSKNQTRDISGGLRGLQTGSESITHAFARSSPNLNPETIC